MATWTFYSDSALTSAYTALTLTATGATFPLYFGSTTTGRKIVSTTTGGQLSISVADSATGGHATTAVKMATTTGGLAGATWGALINIGTSVVGGVAGAWSGYAQLRDQVGDGVYSAELSLVLSSAKEQAVT
jgi:hypothetical protein